MPKCKAKVLLADFARTVKSEHTMEPAIDTWNYAFLYRAQPQADTDEKPAFPQ